jgi:predicted nucleic acid-binding protein
MVNRIYVDTNIFIDLLDITRPSSKVSLQIIKDALGAASELYINSDTVTNSYYVLSRSKKYEYHTLLQLFQKVVSLFSVVPVENRQVMEALQVCLDEATKFCDYEDALQYICAKKIGAGRILTNDKGFISPDIDLLATQK